jgi:hypothetical protein
MLVLSILLLLLFIGLRAYYQISTDWSWGILGLAGLFFLIALGLYVYDIVNGSTTTPGVVTGSAIPVCGTSKCTLEPVCLSSSSPKGIKFVKIAP